MSESPKYTAEKIKHSPGNARAIEKDKIIDAAKESLEIEKLWQRMADSAKKLQLEIEWKWNFNSKTQKERWDIEIEMLDKKRIFVKSFWEKTEIKIENLDMKINHFWLSISWKDWEIFSLWKSFISKIGNEVKSYQGYNDEQLTALIWVANIINLAISYGKKTKSTSENPFFVNSALSGKEINYSTWETAEGIFWKLSWKDFIGNATIISAKWIKALSDRHQGWIMENKDSKDFLEKMSKYLNRRYFDEVVKKGKSSQ
ncbi:MAG: hypothetical protein ACD_3C00125G0006 [uncultured bacterium (gcode 4)]|uniref:Uncharacterized protein n=1 Tax=uncultured bacterium (gcode 4) TaxID=1234023 RepID=K2G149_9BACT|nr:MAG: hypothetical protein ACD_3C00125G0006 [uncultured bacterium (gcode 4)]